VLLLGIRALFKAEKILIYVRELDAEILLISKSDMEDQIRKAEISKIDEIRKSMTSPLWEFCCDLYDRVTDCFVFINHDVGHISWIYYKHHPNRLIDLGGDEGEIKYSFTHPDYRGRGLYPAALKKIQRYLFQNGYKRVFICVHEDNIPSIRGIEKAGFKVVKRMKLIKVMGIQISRKFSSHSVGLLQEPSARGVNDR
jgi:RimJ/RimL family protein N-acetyltransferase